jgi:hypothetical protein
VPRYVTILGYCAASCNDTVRENKKWCPREDSNFHDLAATRT